MLLIQTLRTSSTGEIYASISPSGDIRARILSGFPKRTSLGMISSSCDEHENRESPRETHRAISTSIRIDLIRSILFLPFHHTDSALEHPTSAECYQTAEAVTSRIEGRDPPQNTQGRPGNTQAWPDSPAAKLEPRMPETKRRYLACHPYILP